MKAMLLAAGRGERMRPLTDAHAQAAAERRRQAADRLAPGATGARRHSRRGASTCRGWASRSPRRWAMARARRSHPLQPRALACAGNRRRHLQALPLLGRGALPAGQRRCVHRYGFRPLPARAAGIWRSWCWCPIRRITCRAILPGAAGRPHRRRTRSGSADVFRHALCIRRLLAGCEPGRFPLLPLLLRRAGRAAGRAAPRGAVARRGHAGAPARSSTNGCGASADRG